MKIRWAHTGYGSNFLRVASQFKMEGCHFGTAKVIIFTLGRSMLGIQGILIHDDPRLFGQSNEHLKHFCLQCFIICPFVNVPRKMSSGNHRWMDGCPCRPDKCFLVQHLQRVMFWWNNMVHLGMVVYLMSMISTSVTWYQGTIATMIMIYTQLYTYAKLVMTYTSNIMEIKTARAIP